MYGNIFFIYLYPETEIFDWLIEGHMIKIYLYHISSYIITMQSDTGYLYFNFFFNINKSWGSKNKDLQHIFLFSFYYPLANEVAKGYSISNATVFPSVTSL